LLNSAGNERGSEPESGGDGTGRRCRRSDASAILSSKLNRQRHIVKGKLLAFRK
jgi:hypothetical protein